MPKPDPIAALLEALSAKGNAPGQAVDEMAESRGVSDSKIRAALKLAQKTGTLVVGTRSSMDLRGHNIRQTVYSIARPPSPKTRR